MSNFDDRTHEFWDDYDIPVGVETVIKEVRSGLLRGSNGNGTNASTVVHIVATEPFKAGRLSRDTGRLLCDNSYKLPSKHGERFSDDDGIYVPPITCQTCLDRMKRWRVDE